jgi:putative transposase
MDGEERLFDDDAKQRAWEAISGLLERHGDKRLSMADVDEVAWQLGVSRSTLYRLIAAYRVKWTVSSVEPRSRGRRKNTFVLDRKREKLISVVIREIYLNPERPTMTYLIEQVRARCARAELPPPDRRTIKARVDRIDRRVAALKRKDSRGVKAAKAVPGQYVVSRPLEVVQIDHTEVDLFLVDETTREAMSVRPWLTLAIDVFTRMVVGFHLSMEKPSRVSIGLCMLNAVYDKSAWLRENAIDAPWPAAGLPEALHADNGADFRSRAFAWACREEGIKLIWRPVGAPHYGGHIERLIGTIMGRVHFYPGSTFANPTARQDNDSARFSAMTFREFECALGWEIAGRYNQEIHSALLRPPIAMWREHEAATTLRMPRDRMAFWVSFLPDEYRKLRPDGIWIHDLPYWSNALTAEVGRHAGDLLIKYDPRRVAHFCSAPIIGPFHRSPHAQSWVPCDQLARMETGAKDASPEG